MKLAIASFFAVTTACNLMPIPITATSKSVLAPSDSMLIVAQPVADTARMLVDKMTEGGFPLVAHRSGHDDVRLQFAGNRDFSGTHTLGSVFYAWVVADREGARVTMVGKPTLDHLESCPQLDTDEPKCTTRMIEGPTGTFALGGKEEAQTIRGVFAEVELDADPQLARSAVAQP